MPDAFPRGNVVFCDDIRAELGGKPSLMGIYLDHMYLGSDFPTALQKLCLFITYIEKIDAEPRKVTIKIYLPGDPDETPPATTELPFDEALANATRKTLTGKDAKKITARFALVFSPLNFKEAGELRVIAFCGEDTIELGKLEIIFDPKVFPATVVPN